MTYRLGRWQDRLLLPLSLGIADGIINALILASATVVYGRGLDTGLAARVAAVAFVSSIFTMYVADYAQRRSELVRTEHQLSYTRPEPLATGALGRRAIREAGEAAVVASVASFVGAMAPLLVGAWLRPFGWAAILMAILGLGALGAALARSVGGRRTAWVASLMVCGGVIAVIGTALDIA